MNSHDLIYSFSSTNVQFDQRSIHYHRNLFHHILSTHFTSRFYFIGSSSSLYSTNLIYSINKLVYLPTVLSNLLILFQKCNETLPLKLWDYGTNRISHSSKWFISSQLSIIEVKSEGNKIHCSFIWYHHWGLRYSLNSAIWSSATDW